MLNSLRMHFPKDYDNNQRQREKSLCSAVVDALKSVCADLHVRKNIHIKVKSKIITDIDLAAYEPSTDTVVLFQLKHQELYGSDLHAKNIRSARLKQQTEKWLNAVNIWIAQVGDEGLRSAINVKLGMKKLTIYKVIVTRHYAHPLLELELGNDTVSGNFLQLYNAALLLSNKVEPVKLTDLITLFKTSQAPWGARNYLEETETHWIIDELKFTTTSLDTGS